MRSTAMPASGRHARPGGVLWACVLGGLAGLFHARGASWVHMGMAMALGAGLGIVLALRTGAVADFWAVLCTALVVALCARFQAGWALSRDESLWQRCSFALAVIAVGARLWITRPAPSAPRPDAPRREDAGPPLDLPALPVPPHAGRDGTPQTEQQPLARDSSDVAGSIGAEDAAACNACACAGPSVHVDAPPEVACPPASAPHRIVVLW